jgi:uncharacterized protein
MQTEERDLIIGLFNRLQPFESQPRDPEAERLIAALVQRQPAAPYLLVQTALVQEQALKAAQERIAELEGKAEAKPAGGFLGSAPRLGPWGSRAPQATAPMQTPAPGPMAQQGGGGGFLQGGGGGGFLRSAMATAAGVAGGALLFEGIRNLMSHNPGPFAAAQAAPLLPVDQPADQYSSTDSTDQAQDDSADQAQDDGLPDDYDSTSDDSGFDGGDTDDI